MNTITPESLISQLNWRYAVKKFDATKKIPANTWATLEDSLVLTPSSYGLQPWKFFVVENADTRKKLLPHSWGQQQVVDASHLLVFAMKKNISPADAERLIARTCEVRSLPASALDGYKNMMVGSLTRSTREQIDAWMSRQCFIALGQFMASCALLGVDACPMEGFVPEKYDEVLGLGELGYHSIVVATVGYRANDDAYASLKKVRYSKEELIHRFK